MPSRVRRGVVPEASNGNKRVPIPRSPFGGRSVSAVCDRMHLQLGDGRELHSEAAWAELEARLGAPVPAANLRYWLLGLAAPGAHEWLERDEHSAVLLQDGWRIEFLEYTVVNGQRTPSRMNATHGPARIRLVIQKWRLGHEQSG